MREEATGNALSPTVDSRVDGTTLRCLTKTKFRLGLKVKIAPVKNPTKHI